MLTLDDLKIYCDKGCIELRIDFYGDEKFGRYPEGLPGEMVEEILSKKQLTLKAEGKVVTLDLTKEGNLSFSIERGRVQRNQWERIKKQMREAGFHYRSESPWFCPFKNGQWDWSD